MKILSTFIKQFQYYKQIGEQAIAQVDDAQLHLQPNEASNSIIIIVKHMHGNMLSRWTDFLTTDGEKTWRNRDAEFENNRLTKDKLLQLWEQGWQCMFNALNSLQETDLEKIIYIRNQGHTVIEAIARQLAHYPYHVGQIVYLARMFANEKWQNLSIPKGNSHIYNDEKFSQEKAVKHFTDEYLKKE